jgi:hypothetical protein
MCPASNAPANFHVRMLHQPLSGKFQVESGKC